MSALGRASASALAFLLSLSVPAPAAVAVVNPTCDRLPDATGVGLTRPVFGWELSSKDRGELQTAFRVLVATSAAKLETGRADVWDSGRREGSETAFVPYGGPRLDPGRAYFWKVAAWGRDGGAPAWSGTARFVTELAGPADWSGARWIAFEEFAAAERIVPGVHGNGDALGDAGRRRPVVPLFRKEFDVRGEPLERALAFVCGLGHYELRLNGRAAGDAFLAPGWTDYRKTCLYDTLDVTALVKPGRNAIAAVVGNGFFNVNRERYRKLVVAYGAPMLILELDLVYASGRRETVVSGPGWKTAPSAVTFTSIYGGEDHDARLERPGWDAAGFDDSGWRTPVVVEGPGGRLEPGKDRPVKVMEEILPAAVRTPMPGVFVYDFGRNLSGIVGLTIRGPRGGTVTISPGELLDGRGLVDQSASGSPYRWTYTLAGRGDEEWRPRFTYYGFRYAQVEGAVPDGFAGPGNAPRVVSVKMLHTRNSAPAAGAFACSNPLFDRIAALIDAAVRSNLASVATDCPHREKLGWLEVTHLMGGSIRYGYDILPLYRKIVRDMMDAQLPDGLVPDIAPEFVPFEGGFRDSPEWGSAAVILPWSLYEWYGDRATMAAAYPMMSRYVDYLATKARGHILSHGLGDWFDLGPKPPGEAQLTPKALTATGLYYRDLDLLSRMAAELGKAADAEALRRRAGEVRAAFDAAFFDPETRVYSTGSQAAYAIPLHFGIVDEHERAAVFENLVRSVRAGGNALTAGDVGFDYVLKALEEGGASGVVYDMNARDDVPGYGFQLRKGATALTESWAARRDVSNNHMMLGHLMEWLYSGLGGIRQAAGSTGFAAIEIDPQPVGDITWVRASHRSIRGEIVCSWRVEGGRFLLDAEVPVGAAARVHVPAASAEGITESGIPAGRAAGVRFAGMEAGRAVFEVGSGVFRFSAPQIAGPLPEPSAWKGEGQMGRQRRFLAPPQSTK